MALLGRWEDAMAADPTLPVVEVTYGDGGMAAAVRVATRRAAGPGRADSGDAPGRWIPSSP
jgi:hypothetical protein